MKALKKFLHVLFVGYPHEVVDVFKSVVYVELFWTCAVVTICMGFTGDLAYLYLLQQESAQSLWLAAQQAMTHVATATLIVSSIWLLVAGLIVGVPMVWLAIEQGVRRLAGDTQTNYFESL